MASSFNSNIHAIFRVRLVSQLITQLEPAKVMTVKGFQYALLKMIL